MWPGGPYGRTLHFGIREHAMGSILNGIALHGGTRAYGGTFLVFSDYMRRAVRLAALMKLPVIYVWTHDSIGLGERRPDAPADRTPRRAAGHPWPRRRAARPTPTRPPAAWRAILEHTDRPDRPGADAGRTCRSLDRAASAEGVGKGAYILAEAGSGRPDVILIATGSEVSLAVAARELLEGRGHADPGRVDALPGMVPRAGPTRTSS